MLSIFCLAFLGLSRRRKLPRVLKPSDGVDMTVLVQCSVVFAVSLCCWCMVSSGLKCSSFGSYLAWLDQEMSILLSEPTSYVWRNCMCLPLSH